MADSFWNALREPCFSNDTCRQDRICGSQAGSCYQGGDPCGVEHEVDNDGTDHPSSYHVWSQENCNTLPVLFHITSWQFNAHREALNPSDDSSEFLGDVIFPPPISRLGRGLWRLERLED